MIPIPERNRSPHEACRGFTLMELMVVLLIMGLTMSIVVLKLDGITAQSQLCAAARTLASTIENVRSQAVAQGKNFYVDYDLDNHAYRVVLPLEEQTVEEWMEEDYKRLDWHYLPTGVSFQDIAISSGEVWKNGTRYVGFSPLGNTTIGHIIHLINDEEKQYSVEVNCVTGMVSFYDYYKEFHQIEWE